MKKRRKNSKEVNLLFEAQLLRRIKRTGWQILGENEESVAAHSYLTAIITFVLAKELKLNSEKALIMALFHDFHETRTGDVDKISLNYITRDIDKANREIFSVLPFGQEILAILKEYEEKKSLIARIVYEANILALMVELKGLVDRGNRYAREWLSANGERVKLKQAKKLARQIMTTDSQDFWKDIRDNLHDKFRK